LLAPTTSAENARELLENVDATVGLPLIVAAVLERLGKSSGNHKSKKEKALAGR